MSCGVAISTVAYKQQHQGTESENSALVKSPKGLVLLSAKCFFFLQLKKEFRFASLAGTR